jgi:hypothetical protein
VVVARSKHAISGPDEDETPDLGHDDHGDHHREGH